MEQIEQAVACALSPNADSSLKSQATQYCEQIKSSQDGWQLCLSLFVREPKSSSEARLFSLQVVEDVLQNRFSTLDASHALYIRQTFMEFINREYVAGNDNRSSEAEPVFLKNKLAHAVTLLFINMYPTNWRTFFSDFILLLSANSANSNKRTNHKVVDFFLRVLMAIDEEVVNVSVPRTKEEASRNSLIKDAMREGDVQQIAAVWYELLAEYSADEPEIAALVLKMMGAYVSWVDINLIVTEPLINLIYQFLSQGNLRTPAVECLIEIIGKGMRPLEKLSMLQVLNVGDVLGRLDVSDSDFAEHVAKLTNALGVELLFIWKQTEDQPDARASSYTHIEKLLPYMLKFLGDEYDETSSAVFPFVSELLLMFKRQKKITNGLTATQRELLASLIQVVVFKMKYDPDTEWNDEEEDDEEILFSELRKNLKLFFDSIAAIDQELFSSYVQSCIVSTFETVQNGATTHWTDVELSLHLAYLYGEAIRGPMTFVTTQGNTSVLTPLGEIVAKMVKSNVSAYPHPSIPLPFFENIVRYAQFFETRSDLLPEVLGPFLDNRGLHNSRKVTRSRSWYLFYRFVKLLKAHMGPYVDGMLNSLMDLLVIQVDVSDSVSGASNSGSSFDSQLYLFETVWVEYLQFVFNPIVTTIQECTNKARQAPDDPLIPIHLHHLVMAIGSISKGFPEAKEGVSPIAQVFKQATECILVLLENMNKYEVVRESARFAFARLLNCLGSEILPYLLPLINNMIAECQVTELVDFLPFMGLVIHKFKPSIMSALNDLLLPLLNKVFTFLNQTATGTDEAVLLLDLRKSYLNFIISILNSEMDDVFLTEKNAPHLNTLLQSILYYALDSEDISTQKVAIGILHKFVNIWGGSNANGANTKSIPGFEQFIYEHIVRVCFEVPTKRSFDFADGQAVLVFGELSSLQKSILLKQGPDFLNFMRGVYLPSVNCPPPMIEEYCQAIQQLELKQFKKYFQNFIRNST
ncbi:Xpo1-domain-containing protein [Basidiobolus meristosporus CBS 931.73]|uniref:Exportin-T n=1 Tax=Basidiobolus meristosporus CBS 931.73 TaxID=1314790 RepID=A0A1Y1Z6C9_9FUNG|nr:Xpo1-domain-containing protein [Basidiobolus meristosporus CBS 931.73]|eukprot:ORY05766.1 Xpo1-domain-containing protein [Basidiobolus meristosporus CBS 931.73]